MNKLPLIAITMGDPAGIGPEIIAKIIDNNAIFEVCIPFVIGDAGIMKKLIDGFRLSIKIKTISSPKEVYPI
ncbi:MAG TPA: hypothetical protein VLX29_07545, partial [Nitrospirota bacterium]|nr:hypothetical protein [Nitrospirota bacterium]